MRAYKFLFDETHSTRSRIFALSYSVLVAGALAWYGVSILGACVLCLLVAIVMFPSLPLLWTIAYKPDSFRERPRIQKYIVVCMAGSLLMWAEFIFKVLPGLSIDGRPVLPRF